MKQGNLFQFDIKFKKISPLFAQVDAFCCKIKILLTHLCQLKFQGDSGGPMHMNVGEGRTELIGEYNYYFVMALCIITSAEIQCQH